MTAVTRLYVNNDRVDCPKRGNLDLDICLFCDNLVNVSLDNVQPFIRCTPPVNESFGVKPLRSRTNPKKRTAINRAAKSTQIEIQSEERQQQDVQAIEQIISTSLRHPEWGISRVTEAMRLQGIIVSRRKVEEVFKNHKMVYKADRVKQLLSLAASQECRLDTHQIDLLNKYDPCFEDREFVGKYPGQRLLQTSILVPAKSVKTPLYADVVIDTYSGYTFGIVHQYPSISSHVMLLQQYVFPFITQFRKRPKNIITSSLSVFSDPQFREFLTDLGIQHQRLSTTPAFIRQFQNEFLKPWIKAVPSVRLARGTSLQSHFQKSLREFNLSYPLPGFPNAWRTPQHRIDEYRKNQTTTIENLDSNT